jgi:hypothetical protein
MSVADTLAAGYLARPRVGIVPGFENVLSDVGTVGLMSLPAQNAAIAAGLAAKALDERGLNTRQGAFLESQRQENEEDRATLEKAKRRELFRFAGGVFGVGGGGSLQPPRAANVDPYAVLSTLRNERSAQREATLKKMSRSNAFIGGALDGLPPLDGQ